jgi:hypothetical protein
MPQPSDRNNGVDINQTIADRIRARFPLRFKDKGDTRLCNNSWRFRNKEVTLSVNGRLDVKATMTNNRHEAWIGHIVLRFVDRKGNILATWTSPPKKCKAKSILATRELQKPVRWTAQIDKDVLVATHKIELHHADCASAGTGGMWSDVENVGRALRDITSVGESMAGDIVKILALF